MTRPNTITARLLLLVLASIAFGEPLAFSQPASPAPGPAPQGSLLDARKSFVTKIIRDLRQDRAAAPRSVPHPWQLVHYPSPAGQLSAYLTADPKDGKKRPAVVWAHGGFGGIEPDDLEKMPDDNDQSPHAFVEAGFVVMYPSWRGTNDNPGQPEFFYGEVDDLVAAVRYAGSLGNVDRNRVYVAGHSTGGTLALLAAEASTDIRAAFAFGPTADVSAVAGPGGWPIPFRGRPGEIELRSAIHYIAALKTPTFCIEGSRSQNGRNFGQLQAAAAGAPLRTYIIPHGTHFNILHSLTALLAAKIGADTGPTCNITIDQKEFDDAFNNFLDAKAKARKTSLVTVTPAAAARIAEISAASGHKEVYLRFELTPDEKIQMRLEPAAKPDDTITDCQGVNVALSVEANRSMSPLIIDLDPATRKLKIMHAKEER